MTSNCYIRLGPGDQRPRYLTEGTVCGSDEVPEYTFEVTRGRPLPKCLESLEGEGVRAVRADEGPSEPREVPLSALIGEAAQIERAVAALDNQVDDHWTEQGLPAVHAVHAMAISQGVVDLEVTRDKIKEYAGHARRT